MGDLFWNKVAAVVIGLVLTVMVIGVVSEMVFSEGGGHGEDHAALAYPIDLEAVMGGEASSAPAEEEAIDLGTLLANANASAGERTFRRCAACHNAAPGAANLQGPNLWDVVGRPVASHEGFGYSGAMTDHGGDWTYEELDHFIANPRGYISGTAMSFAGIRNEEDRADLLAYLQTLSDNPVPFPAPAAPAEEESASGGEMDAAGGEMTEAAQDAADQMEAVQEAGEGVIEDQEGEGAMPQDGMDEEGGN